MALLGKNGMGKTTLMKVAMGFLKPTRGVIEFEGDDLSRLTPHEIARRGVGFVPENRRIFPGLTVRENLELGLSSVSHRSSALRRQRLDDVEIDIVHGDRSPKRVPIYVGATGMKMMELAGEIGDGVLLNYLVGPEYDRQALEHLALGAEALEGAAGEAGRAHRPGAERHRGRARRTQACRPGAR